MCCMGMEHKNVQLLAINACTSSPGSGGVTSLDHEILYSHTLNSVHCLTEKDIIWAKTDSDDPMKDNTIIITSFCKFGKVLTCL